MVDQEDHANGLVIKIPASLFEKHDEQGKQNQNIKHDYNFFTRTSIIQIQVKRNTEHGTTEVQSLGFADHDQRLKILELLDTQALYKKLPALLDYIYQLGCEKDGEKRYYAAVAVSELVSKRPFSDLKEAIILPWAKSDNPWIRSSASMALSQVLKHERYTSEVLMLLRHWISIGNPMLTDTALSTFPRIAQSHPNETLEAVSLILKTGGIIHYQSAIELFGIVYGCSPILSIEQLHGWLLPVKNSNLCWMAELLFLIYVRLDDAVKLEEPRKKITEMIFNLWDNPKMPLHQEIQEQTTIKIEEWAREVLALRNKESPEVLKNYLALFHELYWKYKDQRRNRLEFHLQRWEKNREREQTRANRGKGDASLEVNKNVSYLDLMPHSSD